MDTIMVYVTPGSYPDEGILVVMTFMMFAGAPLWQLVQLVPLSPGEPEYAPVRPPEGASKSAEDEMIARRLKKVYTFFIPWYLGFLPKPFMFKLCVLKLSLYVTS